jgi:hypothetical protein
MTGDVQTGGCRLRALTLAIRHPKAGRYNDDDDTYK